MVSALDSRGILEPTLRFETPKNSDDAIKKIVEFVKKIPDWQSASCIVVGAPGKIHPTSRVLINCGNLEWRNVDIAQIIYQELAIRCFIENDANLAGLAEAEMHGFDKGTVLYLTISTGIGSAILENGKLVPATSQSEAGQMMLRNGDEYEIWEKFASGHALYELYDKPAREIHDDSIWYRVSEALIPGILPLIAIVQPKQIIIGGSIGTYFDRYDHHLIKSLEENNVSEMVPLPKIFGAKHAEQAVLYGCFIYGQQQN